MIYYAVFSKLDKSPQAFFKNKRWADRFIEGQQFIWHNAKFTIKEIDLPKVRKNRLVITHKVTWLDYVSHGLGLLWTQIKSLIDVRMKK